MIKASYEINDDTLILESEDEIYQYYKLEKGKKYLPPNIEAIIKSDRQREAWIRFHHLLVKLDYGSWDEVLESAKKYKPD